MGLDVYMKSVGLDTNDIQKLDSHNIMTQCDLTKIQKTNSKIQTDSICIKDNTNLVPQSS